MNSVRTDTGDAREPAAFQGLFATLKHARYIFAENPVSGVAFSLFVLLVICALVGPYIVPYDPLAS